MRAISRDYQTNTKRTHDTAELFLLGGNLNNGTNAGRWYANLNNGLTNANWNYAARNSERYGVSCFVPLEGTSKELGQLPEIDEPASSSDGSVANRTWMGSSSNTERP